MVAVPWQVILVSPLGIALTLFSTILFIFILVLMKSTPAMPFFRARFGKKMILINPDEDRRIVFRVADKSSDMAYVKKRGYYIIDPKHVHIESSSKIPTAITYGSFGESIDVKDAKLAEKLRENGIDNYIGLINSFYDEISADEAFKRKIISEHQYKENPERVYKIPKQKIGKVTLMGESVSFDNIVNYFSRNTRADLIESKIQHRISAMKMEKLGSKAQEFFKWAVILAIVIIAGALAYNMIVMGRAPSPAETQGVGGIVGSGVETITGGSGTGLT